MTTPTPAAKPGALELLKAFLAEHAELIPEIVKAAGELAAGPPTPLTVFGVLHELIDAHNGPIDMERRQQMHDVVSEHEAQVAELVAAAHAHQAPGAPSPAPEPGGSVPAPAPAPASPASLPIDADPVSG